MAPRQGRNGIRSSLNPRILVSKVQGKSLSYSLLPQSIIESELFRVCHCVYLRTNMWNKVMEAMDRKYRSDDAPPLSSESADYLIQLDNCKNRREA